MGAMFAMGPCVACGNLFSFNPERVPSLRRRPDGPREPICQVCVDVANPIREANGLDPIVVYPDSYEATDHY